MCERSEVTRSNKLCLWFCLSSVPNNVFFCVKKSIRIRERERNYRYTHARRILKPNICSLYTLYDGYVFEVFWGGVDRYVSHAYICGGNVFAFLYTYFPNVCHISPFEVETLDERDSACFGAVLYSNHFLNYKIKNEEWLGIDFNYIFAAHVYIFFHSPTSTIFHIR